MNCWYVFDTCLAIPAREVPSTKVKETPTKVQPPVNDEPVQPVHDGPLSLPPVNDEPVQPPVNDEHEPVQPPLTRSQSAGELTEVKQALSVSMMVSSIKESWGEADTLRKQNICMHRKAIRMYIYSPHICLYIFTIYIYTYMDVTYF